MKIDYLICTDQHWKILLYHGWIAENTKRISIDEHPVWDYPETAVIATTIDIPLRLAAKLGTVFEIGFGVDEDYAGIPMDQLQDEELFDAYCPYIRQAYCVTYSHHDPFGDPLDIAEVLTDQTLEEIRTSKKSTVREKLRATVELLKRQGIS